MIALSIVSANLALSDEKPKFATGLIFSVLDKEVKTIDGKDLAKDPVQTVISFVSADNKGKVMKVSKTLQDENGNKTPVVEEEIKVYESRELAISNNPPGSFGFYLKDKKSFVVVSETHWGKSAVLYREREDQHLDSQTVSNWKMLIDINPAQTQVPSEKKKIKKSKHTTPEVESGAN